MHTEARMGAAVVEGGGGGSFAVDGGARNYSPRPQLLRQQGAQHQLQIGTLPHLLAGGVAGAFSKTCTAPLARLTILFQLLQLIPGLDLNKNHASADICVRMVGGGLAGITAASITYPLDLVRHASQLRQIICITEAFRMLFIPYAEMKVSEGYTKVLELHYWGLDLI